MFLPAQPALLTRCVSVSAPSGRWSLYTVPGPLCDNPVLRHHQEAGIWQPNGTAIT